MTTSIFLILNLFNLYAADATINKDLTAEQIEFAEANAPIFIAPNCADNPNIDAFCPLNFDGDWLAGNNLDNISKASAALPTIYFDWYEVTGFIVLSYMQYRPKNEIPGLNLGIGNHAHDTETVIKIFKKLGKPEDSAVVGVEETQPELRAVLANAHGIYVSATPLINFVQQLDRDHTKIAFKGRGMADDHMKAITHNRSRAQDRVFDYSVATNQPAFIYSKPLNHSLVPVMRLAAAEERLDQPATWILRHSSQEQTQRFSRATHGTYELVELAAIVNDPAPIESRNPLENGKTKAQCLFVEGKPLSKASYTDWTGQKVCINLALNRDLQKNLKGEGDQPAGFSHSIPHYKKSEGARNMDEVKKDRIRIVDTPKFLLEAFNDLAKPDEVELIRNPYMIPQE